MGRFKAVLGLSSILAFVLLTASSGEEGPTSRPAEAVDGKTSQERAPANERSTQAADDAVSPAASPDRAAARERSMQAADDAVSPEASPARAPANEGSTPPANSPVSPAASPEQAPATESDTPPDDGTAKPEASPDRAGKKVEGSTDEPSPEVSAVAFGPVALEPLDDNGGANKKVLVLPIEGPIDLGLVPFVDRALDEHSNADAVILLVNTFGGRVDAAVKIRDRLLNTDTPIVAFVRRRAISAGALISLAADQMIFSSGGSMGAATPIQVQDGQAEAVGEKMMSYMRAEMRATAEAKGREPRIAEAMVDKDIEIKDLSPKGKLLTLSTEEAIKIGWANARHDTLDEALGALGLEKAERAEPEVNWAEAFVRFITRPEVSGALMSLGLIALAAELYSPGLGVAGAVGVVFLSLFFGGHMAVHLAGWEEVILCVIGVGFLVVEIFITPGFGLAGVLGIALIGTSLVLALIGMPLEVSWETGNLGQALRSVLLSFVVAAVAMLVVVRFLPSRWASALVLTTEVGDRAKDSAATAERARRQDLLGAEGLAVSALRPTGKARFGDELIDVSSQHGFIEPGSPIRVVSVSGMSVVVDRKR